MNKTVVRQVRPIQEQELIINNQKQAQHQETDILPNDQTDIVPKKCDGIMSSQVDIPTTNVDKPTNEERVIEENVENQTNEKRATEDDDKSTNEEGSNVYDTLPKDGDDWLEKEALYKHFNILSIISQ